LDEKESARQFLELVEGLSFISDDSKSVEINEILDNLEIIHYQTNNFCNEEHPAKHLLKYFSDSSRIPINIRHRFVYVLSICRIGTRYGVSWLAEPYYNSLINLFRDEEIIEFLEIITNDIFPFNIDDFPKTRNNFEEMVKIFIKNTQNRIILNVLKNIIGTSLDGKLKIKIKNEISSVSV
jgi:hypothetical protein